MELRHLPRGEGKEIVQDRALALEAIHSSLMGRDLVGNCLYKDYLPSVFLQMRHLVDRETVGQKSLAKRPKSLAIKSIQFRVPS